MRHVFRLAASVALLVPLGCGSAARPRPAVVPATETTALRAQVEAVAHEEAVPGLSVAWVRPGGQAPGGIAVGIREAGSTAALRVDDALHLGSVTKPLVATLVGRLADAGALALDDDVRPWLDATGESLSLKGLLSHTAGLPALTSFTPEDAAALQPLAGLSPRMQRREAARHLLGQRGAAGAFRYSNAGFVVLSAALEARMDADLESLMDAYVARPLGLTTLGPGWPPREAGTGHRPDDETRSIRPAPLPRIPPFLLASADMHASAVDVARVLAVHLDERHPFLSGRTRRAMHRVVAPVDEDQAALARRVLGQPRGYGLGFVLFEAADGSTVAWHNGTAGTYFAWVTVAPARSLAVVVLANAGHGEAACARVTALVLERLGSPRALAMLPGGA